MKLFNTISILVSNSDHQKCVNFLRAGEKTKVSNFIGWFCVKDKFWGENLREEFTVSTRKVYEKFQQNLNPGFQLSKKTLGKFSLSRREAQHFKFYCYVLFKREIFWAKN